MNAYAGGASSPPGSMQHLKSLGERVRMFVSAQGPEDRLDLVLLLRTVPAVFNGRGAH